MVTARSSVQSPERYEAGGVPLGTITVAEAGGSPSGAWVGRSTVSGLVPRTAVKDHSLGSFNKRISLPYSSEGEGQIRGLGVGSL